MLPRVSPSKQLVHNFSCLFQSLTTPFLMCGKTGPKLLKFVYILFDGVSKWLSMINFFGSAGRVSKLYLYQKLWAI